jgi:TATA-box binding protein (TBP) (component of TFIID and TFIIIB)
MDVNIYDPLNYTIVNNVKIYTGTTVYIANQLNKNIKYYKKKKKGEKLFTELKPSTLTAKGKICNISFSEEDIIDMLTIPLNGYILEIGCNYGVLVNPSPDYIKPEPKKRISNRGRKPKKKPKNKRKIQGSGKYFSSQITFNIYNVDNDKIYKIKLFRNGGFQVPGVKRPDMTDLIKPIGILCDYLKKEFMDDEINAKYVISVMRNYICRIINLNVLVRLNELETMLKNKKEDENVNPIYIMTDAIGKSFNMCQIGVDCVKEYIGKKDNMIGIAEIQNNCERYFGLILKFYRPVPWRMGKRTTIKILRSGKINIDGSNSIEEAYELYHWLEYIFINNYDEILFNTSINTSDSGDYSIGSGNSIYDDDVSGNINEHIITPICP